MRWPISSDPRPKGAPSYATRVLSAEILGFGSIEFDLINQLRLFSFLSSTIEVSTGLCLLQRLLCLTKMPCSSRRLLFVR